MRLPIAVLVALLLTPAAAHAGTVAREGGEIVYRSAPGQIDLVHFSTAGGELRVGYADGTVTAGAGCRAVRDTIRCDLAGVTAVRVLAGDGDDEIDLYGGMTYIADAGPGTDTVLSRANVVTVSLGEGDDRFGDASRAAVVDGGPGDDTLLIAVDRPTGPLRAEGGEGNDRLIANGRNPDTALSGGPGDDVLSVSELRGPGVSVACGPGNDRWLLGVLDQPGDGCAPSMSAIATDRVTRDFAATLTGPASGSVTVYRYVDTRRSPPILRGAFASGPAPLHVRLKTTRFGARLLRREPRPDVRVSIRLRSGGDRGELYFDSRLR